MNLGVPQINLHEGQMCSNYLLLLVFNNKVKHRAAPIRPSTQVKCDAIGRNLNKAACLWDHRFGAFGTCIQNV
jgi:hypothetical protein